MSVKEWRSELKGITWVLIAAAVIEGGRRLLGFTTEKINSIDVLLWTVIFALVQLAKLILDCVELILNELKDIRQQNQPDRERLRV